MGGRGLGVCAVVCAALVAHCSAGNTAPPDDVPLPDRLASADAGGDSRTSDVETIVQADPPCDPATLFGAPVALAGFDPALTYSTPRLSSDELTIYFTTHLEAGAAPRIARAVRASRTAPFGPVEILTAQSSTANDNDPSVSDDHLSLWFHSTRSGNADLYAATRATTANDFGAPSPVVAVNTTAPEAHAFFRQAASELWFVSNRGTNYDIYVSTRTVAGFGVPSLVAELNSTADEWQPMVTEDGLVVLFASNRTSGKSFDLWTATRTSASAPWGTPRSLDELNSTGIEQAGWMSRDRCRVYFSSDRAAPGVRSALYSAQR